MHLLGMTTLIINVLLIANYSLQIDSVIPYVSRVLKIIPAPRSGEQRATRDNKRSKRHKRRRGLWVVWVSFLNGVKDLAGVNPPQITPARTHAFAGYIFVPHNVGERSLRQGT